jgi:hypothetical protein
MLNAKTQKDRIEELKNNGYQLDFGTVFENAFENYKKIAIYAGLMLLVFSILMAILFMAGLVAYIGVDHLEEFANKMKQLQGVKVMPIEIALPLNAGIILFSTIINPFMAGFLKMADCGDKDEEFHVSSMFSYYKVPYFSNLTLSVFIIGFISTGLTMLLQYSGYSFTGTIISLTISFFTILTVPFIVFEKMNAIEAIKSSCTIVSKQPLVIIGLIIVAAIGGVIGIFGLCIGVFFTMPFMYSMNYTIYKTIIGIDDTSEIDEITGTEN